MQTAWVATMVTLLALVALAVLIVAGWWLWTRHLSRVAATMTATARGTRAR